jgi:hypothetical protein
LPALLVYSVEDLLHFLQVYPLELVVHILLKNHLSVPLFMVVLVLAAVNTAIRVVEVSYTLSLVFLVLALKNLACSLRIFKLHTASSLAWHFWDSAAVDAATGEYDLSLA